MVLQAWPWYRVIPQGALTGLQWIQTPDYVQAIGFLDQTLVNIAEGDWGGEMDPHGADLVSLCSSGWFARISAHTRIAW